MSIHIEHLLIDLLNAPSGIPQTTTLWIADESLSEQDLIAARPRPSLDVLTNRCDLGARLSEIGHTPTVSDFDFSLLPNATYDDIVYRVSKERLLVHHCINESYKHLNEGGSLHLIGSKDEGIRTHGRNAQQVFATNEHAKKHGDVYHIRLQKPSASSQSTPDFLDSKDYGHLRNCTVGELHFVSKPGVFGWNKVDRGSALLAEYVNTLLAKKKSPGSVLDLGCGYGYLLLATAALPFSKRHGTDNNAAAVDAAKASFARAELSVQVTLDDCAAQLEGGYDWILCNPPFHQGFSTSGALAETFLSQIKRLLSPQGRALVVVNQFIPVERVAQGKFNHIETVLNEHGFKVLQLH
jgi:16S rRNA (guanine1207-N2)-methyltransferase